ncbi:MAG: class I SAM-dependent methyltransferase [Candidatus Omnitrophica bacterium]|nr:class I SAM-dependent methyltransferase [Candidatus Omnitrophota bacterium]MBU1783734.1 class I SAM-dependent methyltransferase [Candidatus Omnitrophota bacterium]
MRDDLKERFPRYVPLYYRVLVKTRKIYRQAMVRLAEVKARSSANSNIIPDDDAVTFGGSGDISFDRSGWINKSAAWINEDMTVPGVAALTREIDALKKKLDEEGLKYTNTAGTFLSRMFYPRSEETKLWENTWTLHCSGVRSAHRVLDIGGASTIFSFYLASIGCSVSVIDNDWGNCGTLYNANYVAKKMGWNLKAYDRNIAKGLPFPDDHFDRVFSICTVEHLSSDVRRRMMREVGRVLKPGGIAGITMCYCNDLETLLVDKGLRFAFRTKLAADIIRPSGLKIYGNTNLVDEDLGNNFLGALFLVKEGER